MKKCCHRQQMDCGGDLAHWTTLRKIFSSHGIWSLESAVKSYTSWAWSSNAWKSGFFNNATLITNLLWHSPTYTTKWPFGTSRGTIISSCNKAHTGHVPHVAQGITLSPILRHFFIHDFRNFPFVIIFSLLFICVIILWSDCVSEWEREREREGL